jgi:preprotein translocase subunit SecF
VLMKLIPNFKGKDFFPHNLRLPFMRYKDVAIIMSIVAMLASLALFMTRGLNYGVDFKGGSMIEVQATNGVADVSALRETLGKLGLGGVQIQSFGGPADVLIRIEEQPGGEKAQQDALNKVVGAIGAGYTQRRVEVVGPAVSSELRTTGFIAVAWQSLPTSGSASNGSLRPVQSSR